MPPTPIPLPEPMPIPPPNPLLYGGPGPVLGAPGGANFLRPPPFGLIYYPDPLETPLILTLSVSPCFREKSTGALLNVDF